ncbi:MAG: hypothetical protein ACM3UU_02930 [Ignavibacteriales bacterium]
MKWTYKDALLQTKKEFEVIKRDLAQGKDVSWRVDYMIEAIDTFEKEKALADTSTNSKDNIVQEDNISLAAACQ